jgi:hypothetical protein
MKAPLVRKKISLIALLLGIVLCSISSILLFEGYDHHHGGDKEATMTFPGGLHLSNMMELQELKREVDKISSSNATTTTTSTPSILRLRSSPLKQLTTMARKGTKDAVILEEEEEQTTQQQYHKMMIPNLLLAGVQKGGTTTTFDYLASYTESVCKPKRFRGEPAFHKKEVHFFDKDRRYQKGLDFYEQRFAHCNSSTTTVWLLDGTPDYFTVPERIHQFYQQQQQQQYGLEKSLKIILSLREPASRELSWYYHMRRLERWHHAIQNNNGSLMTFDEYVDQRLLPQNKISQSCYGIYGTIVPRWVDLFPRDHLLVLSFDESQSHPERYLKRIHDFLNLPVNHRRPLAFGERTFSAQVASGNASATEQDETNTTCSALDKLWEAFASSNQKLYELLERHPGPSMEERPFQRFSHPCKDTKS